MSKQYLKTVISTFAVFPAKAGIQSYYEVQSPLKDELDTRLREYDDSTNDEAA